MTSGAVPLIDPHGRQVRDLRISVTDRCNFRCTYCMPAEGMNWLPREEVLTFEEIERVARVCVERFGFDGIRLTGGEPTVRAHLPVLVERLAALGVDLAMTTNGVALPLLADELKRAGLRRLNISIDSLRA
ncbi:MAG: radical SAM protein, partial [Acidimicrobiales bacterium]